MSDIVERIRYRHDHPGKLADEAADEIERLREALQEIADEHPYPGMGEELQDIARRALAHCVRVSLLAGR